MKSVFTEQYKQLLNELIAARKNANLTQSDLAQKLGRLQTFVSKYERGERRLDVIEFIQVAKALNLKASSIIVNIEENYF